MKIVTRGGRNVVSSEHAVRVFDGIKNVFETAASDVVALSDERVWIEDKVYDQSFNPIGSFDAEAVAAASGMVAMVKDGTLTIEGIHPTKFDLRNMEPTWSFLGAGNYRAIIERPVVRANAFGVTVTDSDSGVVVVVSSSGASSFWTTDCPPEVEIHASAFHNGALVTKSWAGREASVARLMVDGSADVVAQLEQGVMLATRDYVFELGRQVRVYNHAFEALSDPIPSSISATAWDAFAGSAAAASSSSLELFDFDGAALSSQSLTIGAMYDVVVYLNESGSPGKLSPVIKQWDTGPYMGRPSAKGYEYRFSSFDEARAADIMMAFYELSCVREIDLELSK
jgi:hypothetical protein